VQKGITKNPFLDRYTSPLVAVDFEGAKESYFIVAEFGSANLCEQISFFIHSVYEFKQNLGIPQVTIRKASAFDILLKNGESTFRNPYCLLGRTAILLPTTQ
jgi:hypothetical protein